MQKFPGIPVGNFMVRNSREFPNGNSRWPWFVHSLEMQIGAADSIPTRTQRNFYCFYYVFALFASISCPRHSPVCSLWLSTKVKFQLIRKLQRVPLWYQECKKIVILGNVANVTEVLYMCNCVNEFVLSWLAFNLSVLTDCLDFFAI